MLDGVVDVLLAGRDAAKLVTLVVHEAQRVFR